MKTRGAAQYPTTHQSPLHSRGSWDTHVSGAEAEIMAHSNAQRAGIPSEAGESDPSRLLTGLHVELRGLPHQPELGLVSLPRLLQWLYNLKPGDSSKQQSGCLAALCWQQRYSAEPRVERKNLFCQDLRLSP